MFLQELLNDNVAIHVHLWRYDLIHIGSITATCSGSSHNAVEARVILGFFCNLGGSEGMPPPPPPPGNFEN